MSQPFAIFDIDGTLIRWQLYHAIANTLAKQGYFAEDEDKHVRQARMTWKNRTSNEAFKAYEHELIAAYDKMLLSITAKDFSKAADAVFEEYKDQVYTYTRDLIKDLKSKGYMLLAVSGSQTEIVEKIANYYGFDDFCGSIYERAGDRFTGNKEVIAADKRKALEYLMKKHTLDVAGSVAVGDTYSDIPVLELVERPVAFNPEVHLYNHARANSWEIVVERKNVVYNLRAQNGQYFLA